MSLSNQLKNQHLLWRAGFGPLAEEAGQIRQARTPAYVKALFNASSRKPEYIDVADNAIKGLLMGIQDINRQQRPRLSNDEKKKLRQKSKEDIRTLNLAWLGEMINSDQQLREKMSLFWHGHFASRNLNILYQQQLLAVIRENALGNFGDLLRAVSKSAAMINFLNNNQNRKDHPNENFAREVMELFTMGRGNYTEEDVKEGARAFTGWGANLAGDFVFRRFQHDAGNKTFLGHTGHFDGDDILNLLLEQEATARFICRKIYRYFVNDQPDEEKLKWLAARFYQSGYDIAALMNEIFSSEWFYAGENIGTRIKSPVELIVGIQRQLPMKLENPEVQILIQRLLGQLLFFPPNVAGWPGGTNWIDSSSLMLRLRIPQILYRADELAMQPKTDDDQMMGMKDDSMKGMGRMGARLLKATIDWDQYMKSYSHVSRAELLDSLSGHLLQTRAVSSSLLNQYTDAGSRENYIRSATMRIMSSPEYQLC